jgi:deoxyribonuclease-4
MAPSPEKSATRPGGSGLREALRGRRVGVHAPLGRGMVKAALRAAEVGANTIQVFSDNPSAWKRRAEPPAELGAFRAALAEHDIAPLAIHGPYLLNLAGPDETIWERSIDTLARELRAAAAYGASFVNIHLGSHRGSGVEVGIGRIGSAVEGVLAAVPPGPSGAPLLVLENSAGGGDGIGGTVEELAAVLDAIESRGGDGSRIAFCLDTAHAWGSGYELSRPEATDALLERLDILLGYGRIAMVHLNDSRAGLGSHADRHEHIGAGQIGGIGMGHILRHERLRGVPFYLETPGMDEGFDAVNMDRVRLLLQGEPLPPLPAEAAAVRRSDP